MTNKACSFKILTLAWLLMTMTGAGSLYAASLAKQSQQPTPAVGSTQGAAVDVKGTWSGTFFSRHSNVPPFSMTVVITPNLQGHLTGDSTLNSICLKGAKLQVTVTGLEVVLAGSDREGDNITVRGTLDTTGTMLQSTYILNGSASGSCETDDGTGSLAKQ